MELPLLDEVSVIEILTKKIFFENFLKNLKNEVSRNLEIEHTVREVRRETLCV